MYRRDAQKIDRAFYVELDRRTNLYCVFGDNSGFAYSTHMCSDSAQEALENMEAFLRIIGRSK